jgi:GTPase
MLPIIAIVGRPNVGKSTLFNRLTKTRDAIVDDMPGLTRDRQYGIAKIVAQNFIVIDTGGIGSEDNTAIAELTTKQTMVAMQEAQAIIFLVDARTGIVSSDINIAKIVRKLNKPIYLAVNKVDGLDAKFAVTLFYELGLGEVYPIAAEQGFGVEALVTKILADLTIDKISVTEIVSDQSTIKIAFVGRPNVGKSTLLNKILGAERVLVYDAPGTTRDSIYVNFERLRQNYTLIDTAGIRRRGKIDEAVEKFSVVKAMQAIAEAHVVVILLDAKENITEQDLRLLGFILDAGKALVIAVNKWDGLPETQRDKIRSELERRLDFINFAKIYFISALHGTGVGNLFNAIDKAYKSATLTVGTPEVTRILIAAVDAYPPPMVHGRRIKLRYAHMGGQNPPTFIVHGNQTSKVPDSYKRYLEHYYLKVLRLSGTPVRVEFKTSHNPYKTTR